MVLNKNIITDVYNYISTSKNKIAYEVNKIYNKILNNTYFEIEF